MAERKIRDKQQICLVSCGAHKLNMPSPAHSLYNSELFLAARNFARRAGDRWFILSAKHWLLPPDQVIAPYDEALADKSLEEKAIWAKKVFEQIEALAEPNARLIFLAGATYREPLEELLSGKGYECVAPLQGLPIGRQLRWLQRAASEAERLADLQKLYAILAKMRGMPGQFVKLSELRSHGLPEKGIYFFFDRDEKSRISGQLPRLVRIGTHGVSLGSKATLWQRLRTHRGTGDASGNHRSSIFRLHVGAALLASRSSTHTSWGRGQDAPQEVRQLEISLEREVSQYLGQLLVAHIAVSDAAGPDSDRSYLERNSIAIVSGGTGLDWPSQHWLGSKSPSASIRDSGLWNVNYVGEEYDAEFLKVLESYVNATLGNVPVGGASLAPPGWRRRISSGEHNQLPLQLT
jgi:hypothetical protein